ncbi:Pyrimidine 5'-nucleotidase YjjG [Nocardia otitidiscaviarum]|uniref:Pyrimidine 5'-nucleotidase YjjG n=1 Tax=Nocardia otitidiscaviarum TaxID=1823 RepID=A0A379JKX0_9NOCA|nr:HAD family hydrolase [Nocardia otitidiscaviarum]SUD48871.1 Pyrimidine 5'-nucleotidase YjjG [Nocardia otitidiscaviarum]
MTVRGILFDVDDTLVDYSATARAGILAHLAAEGLLDRFESAEHAVALWKELEEREYPRYLAGELTFTGQQELRSELLLAHIGASTDDPRAWFDRYVALRDTTWAAFPDAEPLLSALTGRIAVGVVSNSSRSHQVGKLRTVGLLPHFGEAVLCSAEFGTPKPRPDIFLAGCELLGLPPQQVAYVGDRWDVDGVGARDAGLHAYWLNRAAAGTTVRDGVTVIHSLTSLSTL